MNEKFVDDSLNSSNLDQHQFEISNDLDLVTETTEKKKKCCCCVFCYYLFCCCCFKCCKSEDNLQKNLFIAKWKVYVQHNHEKEDTDLPFLILTNLYTKNFNNALEQLHSIRINPNYLIKFRTDLEFYIPQLCTFLLFCGEKDLDEFFVFLCRACGLNLYFAHRVHWFLSAMLNDTNEKKNEIENILLMLNTLFKSESPKEKSILKNFYIEKGDEYIELIKQNNLDFLYNNSILEKDFEEIKESELNENQQIFYEKFKKSRMIIEKYSDLELRKEMNKNNNLELTSEEEKIIKYKFNPNDFYIDISNFQLLNKDFTIDEYEAEEEENNLNFENINKYLDLNFISYHSSINFINHLCDLSNELPKYSEEQQMNFLYEEINKINKKLPCNVYLPFMSNKCRHYFILHIPLDGIKIFRTKTRAPIMLTFEICLLKDVIESAINNGDLIDNSQKSRSQTLNSQSLVNTLNNNDNEKDDEILLCKPLKVSKNIETKKKKQSNLLYDDEIVNENIEEKKVNMIKERIKIFNLNKKGIYMRKKNANTVFESVKPNILNSKLDDNIIEKKIDDLEINTNIDKNEKITNQINKDIKINEEINNKNNNINNNQISNIEEIKKSFGETFQNKKKSIKLRSLFGKIKSHNIFRCIIKTNEDLRQEQFATQLINEFNQIFQITNSHCWLNTYEIISTGNNSGLVEMVNDSLSLDQLKQKLNGISLNNFYTTYFNGKQYETAIENLCQSLAGYSLVCYFLQIKDRHNGNILIDINGHIIHIDFGFLLSNAPGKGLKFENAPFKLTNDFVECLGGINGVYFRRFVNYLNEGFYNIHIHRQKIIILVEMMWCGHGTGLPCFENKQQTIDDLKERLSPRNFNKDSHGNMDKKDCFNFVNSLISQSVDNWRTKCYDWFQYKVQGIFY